MLDLSKNREQEVELGCVEAESPDEPRRVTAIKLR
jgi:hypothetical protein